MNRDPSSSRVQFNTMWLDLFPHEVCTRIAAHVARGTQTVDALSLAESSVTMRIAVMSALGHQLQLLSENADDLSERWFKFVPYARSIVLGAAKYSTARSAVGEPNGKKRCISTWDGEIFRKSKHLESVTFWIEPSILLALDGLQSLRRLVIKSTDSHNGDLLFKTLQTLEIQELVFRCEARDIEECLFSKSKYFTGSYNALAESCPRLEKLEVFCICLRACQQLSQNMQSMLDVYNILPALRSLKYLSLLEYPAQSLSPEVCAIPSVEMPCSTYAYGWAMKLRQAATVIHCSRFLDTAEVKRLEICYSLSVLDICIKEGVENVLPQLARKLPNLRSLRVQMAMRCEVANNRFILTEITPGTMLQTVRNAEHLDTLQVVDMQFSVSELHAILVHIGVKLRDFCISLSDQEGSAFQKLEALLCAAALHNTELRLLTTVLRTWIPSKPSALTEQARRIYTSLCFLEKRAPYLDACALKRLLRIHGLDRAYLDWKRGTNF